MAIANIILEGGERFKRKESCSLQNGNWDWEETK